MSAFSASSNVPNNDKSLHVVCIKSNRSNLLITFAIGIKDEEKKIASTINFQSPLSFNANAQQQTFKEKQTQSHRAQHTQTPHYQQTNCGHLHTQTNKLAAHKICVFANDTKFLFAAGWLADAHQKYRCCSHPVCCLLISIMREIENGQVNFVCAFERKKKLVYFTQFQFWLGA